MTMACIKEHQRYSKQKSRFLRKHWSGTYMIEKPCGKNLHLIGLLLETPFAAFQPGPHFHKSTSPFGISGTRGR